MKRNSLVIFLLICTALLFGCNSRHVASQSSPAPTSTVPTPSSSIAADPITNTSQSDLSFTNCAKGAETEDGFYSVSYYDDWSGCLVFYDYRTRQTTPVCNEINCQHHSDTCTAWFGDANNIPRIVSNNRQLIYCYMGLSGQVQKPALIEIANLDGSNRRVLNEFAPNETLYEAFCVDSGYIYTLVTRVYKETLQIEQALERIDLNSGVCDELWHADVPAGTAYFLSGCVNHQPVIKMIAQSDSQDDERAAIASQTHTLIMVSPADGTCTLLYSWQQNDGLEAPLSDTLYYITKDHFLCRFAADNTLEKIIQDERLDPITTQIQYADDSQLWFTSNPGGDAQSGLFQLNFCDNQIEFCPLSQARALQILGEYGSEVFVMAASDSRMESEKTCFMADKAQLTLPADETVIEKFADVGEQYS